MSDTLYKGIRVDNGEWVDGYFVRFKTCRQSSIKYFIQTMKENDELDVLREVIPESVTFKIEYLNWKWKDENGHTIIKETYVSDTIEFSHNGKKHIGILDMCCDGLIVRSETLDDGYIFVHEFKEYFDDDIDGIRYIKAKLLDNRFDNENYFIKWRG